MTIIEVRDFLLNEFPMLDTQIEDDWIKIIKRGEMIAKFRINKTYKISHEMLRMIIKDGVDIADNLPGKPIDF